MPTQTPSQTLGPFFAYALTPAEYGRVGVASNVLVDANTSGKRIHVIGRVVDGAGAPVGDAMVEIWQANALGRYNHPDDDREAVDVDPYFSGFGRCGTDDDGYFDFQTIKPGSAGETDAPHINVCITARGMLLHMFTRMYFDDEADANAADRALALVPDARRRTLIAERSRHASEFRWAICLQGEGETVFFDV
jgi:protocatechuate 3,4-dioxygenase, alpha subunit